MLVVDRLEVMLPKPEDYKLQDKHVQEIKAIAKDAEAEIYKEALSKVSRVPLPAG